MICLIINSFYSNRMEFVMKSFIEKIKCNDDITIEFVGDSITKGMNYCHAEET